jgi:hypothetical protein
MATPEQLPEALKTPLFCTFAAVLPGPFTDLRILSATHKPIICLAAAGARRLWSSAHITKLLNAQISSWRAALYCAF